MFNLEQFKKQLAETIAWCAPRVNVEDVGNSLRTLLPDQVRELRDYDLNMRLVRCVVDIRAILLEDSYKEFTGWNKPIPPLPVGLAEGRLMIFYPGRGSYDAAAQAATTYFDIVTIPAWDTWAYFGAEANVLDWSGNWRDIQYLICWIPPQVIKQVNYAIDADPSSCIQWLTRTDVELGFFEKLKAEGLFR